MDQKEKNESIILSDIFRAVKNVQTAKGNVEVFGIMNAVARAMKEDKNCLVLFQPVVQNGKTDKTFVLMKDKEGRTLFPLFTDMTKVLPVKEMMEKQGKVEIGVMNLKMVIGMLAMRQMCDGVMVNPYLQNFKMPLNFYVDAMKREPVSHITLIAADCSQLYVDAMMCPTDATVGGVSALEAEILQTGGEVFREAVNIEKYGGLLEPGDVIAVQGGENLHSKYVLFANVPNYKADMKVEDLFLSYLNCMNTAKELNCTSIVFPCNTEAMNGLPEEAMIGMSTAAVSQWLTKHADFHIDVYFCCASETVKENYQKFFDGLNKK